MRKSWRPFWWQGQGITPPEVLTADQAMAEAPPHRLRPIPHADAPVEATQGAAHGVGADAQALADGGPMGALHDQSRFAATIEEVCALVEDSKAAHPDLANRAMALKALAGRCDLDILIVAQLNRGAYG